ncbi:unnamed protein product [Cylicostephanus goldi]|uniref:Glycosyltransferase family 92 protein n=1 Tax=Cylicostephanus goldi TaxID=71465 RepID=A0A3P6RX93_CYLGO|nr:unnamed protein product [Cylicostephanus goldi]
MELTPATMSVVFPEFTTYCCKRKGAYYMSITENISDDIVDMVPVVGRTDKHFKYNLSMCVKPMYGMDTKFLLFAEFVEHYKLQGVQHFYVYVKDLDNYTKKVILRISKSKKRVKQKIWQHSRYVIFADLDERILPLRNLTLKQLISLVSIVFCRNEMKSRPACGMMRFVTQWILKTGANPNIYEVLQLQKTSSYACLSKHIVSCVFLMWVHHVEIYFPTFEGYEVPATDAVIRHYRDIASGDWARLYLPEVETFGPFSMNAYPADLMSKLFRNMKYVLDNVYRPFQ